LGAWIAGSVLMIAAYFSSLDAAGMTLNSPVPAVAAIQNKLGYDDTAMFARHVVADQIRKLSDSWELTQMALAVALGGCLFLATQRRIFPLALCGLMLVLAAFQHFAVSPELAYRGRDMDFPPGNTNIGIVTRVYALRQVYFGAESVKLLAGGLLASYLFVFRTPQRRSRKEQHALREVDLA
jgi:hypothetical protein